MHENVHAFWESQISQIDTIILKQYGMRGSTLQCCCFFFLMINKQCFIATYCVNIESAVTDVHF